MISHTSCFTPRERIPDAHCIKVSKVKVRLSLGLTKYHTMKMYGNGSRAPHILTLALDGGDWSASCPGYFTPGERAHSNHCIKRLDGPQSQPEHSKVIPVLF